MSNNYHKLASFIGSIRNLLRILGKASQQKLPKDRRLFLTDLRESDGERGVRLDAREHKAVMNALGERDESAEICHDRDGRPESDPDLRDAENVRLKESRVEGGADFGAEQRGAVLGAENDVDEKKGERLGHGGVGLERAFSPSFVCGLDTWGVAPGWHKTAPLALQRRHWRREVQGQRRRWAIEG